MTTIDHRQSAEAHIRTLIAAIEPQPSNPEVARLVQECGALAVAIHAFHMEGIRFRMFNVDRILQQGQVPVPPAATAAFQSAREHLEAAGFHTRSHQAPTP